MTVDEVAARFRHDVDDIAKELIAAFSLKFSQEIENLNSPLLRWLDFRYRYVEPKSRQIFISDRFPKKNLPPSAQVGLKKFIEIIQSGGDINPYQGRGLILRNDTSSKKNSGRTDLLWADWNIHHFHLSPARIPDGQFFSHPSDYLAFCIVGWDMVALIDVLRHPDYEGFSNPDLMAIIKRNWPNYMEQFRLNGITAKAPLSQEQIHALRSKGVNHMMNIDGQAYMAPGMGVTSASTPMRITMAAMHVLRNVDFLAQRVCDPQDQFQMTLAGIEKTQSKFKLVVLPKGLCVYEEASQIAFLLPRQELNAEPNPLADLHDCIAPAWAVCNLGLSDH